MHFRAGKVNLVPSLLVHLHPGFGLGRGSQSVTLYPVSSLGFPGFPSKEMGTKEAFEFYPDYYGEPKDFEQESDLARCMCYKFIFGCHMGFGY